LYKFRKKIAGNISDFFDNEDSKSLVKALNEEINTEEGANFNQYLEEENKVLNKELEEVKNEFEDALDEIDYLNAKIEEMEHNFSVKLIKAKLDIAKKIVEDNASLEKIMKHFEM
jgi:predicted  nucleic acid-binding Zn-ribbon protein